MTTNHYSQSPRELTGADERRRRWRLILGQAADRDSGEPDRWLDDPNDPNDPNSLADQILDRTLAAIYHQRPDGSVDRTGDLGRSAPRLLRLLGDIREYFPGEAGLILRRDAVERFGLAPLLADPEFLAAIEPDQSLLPVLLTLAAEMPEETRRVAREIVRRLVERLSARLRQPLRGAVELHLGRSRPPRPRSGREIDWMRTIRANLASLRPGQPSLIPARIVARRRALTSSTTLTIIICLDQSASMAGSAVHAAIIASLLARIPALRTHLLAFDTSVVDLSRFLDDPVDLLFGLNLGGGTNIRPALEYAGQLIDQPASTIIFLISDLFDAGERAPLLATVARLGQAGVRVVPLLALADEACPAGDGRPALRFNEELAAAFDQLGLRAATATPDRFPDLLLEILSF